MAMITIASYKLDLIEDILNTQSIINGIDSQQSDVDPEMPDSLLYKNIFPYMKVLDTQTIADAYILLETDILNISRYNPTYAKYRIKLRVLVHEDRMRMEDFAGTRLDYLYEELKDLFDGQTKYGFSELELTSRIADVYNEKYHFLDMMFYTNDLRKSVCKAKQG